MTSIYGKGYVADIDTSPAPVDLTQENGQIPPLPEGDRFRDVLAFRYIGKGGGRTVYECWDEAVYAYARDYAAAEVAKERERAFYWCDFYAHSIDHGGNKYVRSNDALTAAHAVKSGIPFPAKDAAAIRAPDQS